MTIWKWVGRTADVATVVLAIALTGLIAARFFGGARPPKRPPAYAAGESVPLLKNVDYSASDKTLAIVVRHDCHFCTDSLPFYGRLIAERNARSERVQIVVVAPEEDRASQQFLGANVRPDTFSVWERGRLKIQGTPSVMLVDRSGRLIRLWEGRLTEKAERELISAVFTKVATGSSEPGPRGKEKGGERDAS
jgi:hypothetical protein